MNTSERRTKILNLMYQSSAPISGSVLARECGVSRQIIVSDIAALREKHSIIATSKGYICQKPKTAQRVLKLVHSDEEIEAELSTIVKNGGRVKDVFVWHKIYGKIEAPMEISTLMDIAEYIESLKTGRSRPLKKVTYEYHYHTIEANDEETLDKVEKALDEKGFLVKEEI
jgi:transcriptional regulator of NAD metabolism